MKPYSANAKRGGQCMLMRSIPGFHPDRVADVHDPEEAHFIARQLNLFCEPDADVRLSGPFHVGHVKLYHTGFTYTYPIHNESDASIVAWVGHHDNDVAKNRAELLVTLLNELTGFNT